MIRSRLFANHAVTAPHHLAARAGDRVLADGGNAIEAMIAAAAVIAVAYPHMNSLGGDAFWLVAEPGEAPYAIDACGPAAAGATRDFYVHQGLSAIPSRGPLAALTVAGTVAGWGLAHERARAAGGRLPLGRLLEDAIALAREGVPVTASLNGAMTLKYGELRDVPGYADVYLDGGRVPAVGALLKLPKLASALARLAEAGTDDFYRGDLARSLAGELEAAGSPVRLADLEAYRAEIRSPLTYKLDHARLYNFPPPTQGLASLLILAIFERLKIAEPEGFAHVHGLVEATKQAFRIRNAEVTDPRYMRAPAESFLAPEIVAASAGRIDRTRAAPWPHAHEDGDTVWMGAIDRDGRMVSFIQSIYWEFGSGVTLPSTGIHWQNRGISFSLDATARNGLEPGRKPFHTLNPAMAVFDDGRRMVYGTMGGDGQPQTQAAVFSRYGLFGEDLQAAISAPRWLLGRTWGSSADNLKLEGRFQEALLARLRRAGHEIEVVDGFSERMGHAGGIVRHPSGVLEAASDPRSDGAVAGL